MTGVPGRRAGWSSSRRPGADAAGEGWGRHSPRGGRRVGGVSYRALIHTHETVSVWFTSLARSEGTLFHKFM